MSDIIAAIEFEPRNINSIMVEMAQDGSAVRINWELVSRAAVEEKTQAMTQFTARALLAVRDGAWKPLT